MFEKRKELEKRVKELENKQVELFLLLRKAGIWNWGVNQWKTGYERKIQNVGGSIQRIFNHLKVEEKTIAEVPERIILKKKAKQSAA